MSTPYDRLREAMESLNAHSIALGTVILDDGDVVPELIAPILGAQQELADSLDAVCAVVGDGGTLEEIALYNEGIEIFAGVYLSHKLQQTLGPEGEARPFARIFSEVQKNYVRKG